MATGLTTNPRWADRAGAVGSVVAICTGVSLRPGCASFSSPTSTTRWPSSTWVVRTAPHFDLVVLAGDQLDVASAVPLDAQSAVLLRYAALIQEATTLAISSGNHDLTGPDSAGEQCALWLRGARADDVATDGDPVELGDTLVTICP